MSLEKTTMVMINVNYILYRCWRCWQRLWWRY